MANYLKVAIAKRRKEAAKKGAVTRLKNKVYKLESRVADLECRNMVMEDLFGQYGIDFESEIADVLEDKDTLVVDGEIHYFRRSN